MKRKDKWSQCILEHELVHYERIKKIGIFKWYLLYMFNPKFRLNEEILAYRKQKRLLEEYGLAFDLDRYSETLSSWIYLRMVSKEEAKELLSLNQFH
ncbi:MAG: hypothetical protein AB9915_00290 [Candidatus Dojkabacteria bacterium]